MVKRGVYRDGVFHWCGWPNLDGTGPIPQCIGTAVDSECTCLPQDAAELIAPLRERLVALEVEFEALRQRRGPLRDMGEWQDMLGRRDSLRAQVAAVERSDP